MSLCAIKVSLSEICLEILDATATWRGDRCLEMTPHDEGASASPASDTVAQKAARHHPPIPAPLLKSNLSVRQLEATFQW